MLSGTRRIFFLLSVVLLVSTGSWGIAKESLARQVQTEESDQAIERILLRGLTRLYVEDYPGAVAVFEEGLKLQPDNPTLLASISRAKGALGDPEAARFFLRRALDLDSENIHLWEEWAMLNLELNDVSESTIALIYLIENQAPSWPSRIKLNHLYFQTERYIDALRVLDTGLRADGRIPELLSARVLVLEKIGRTDELAQSLFELSELQPGDTDLYYRLAIARIRLEDWTGAEAALIRLLEVDPDHVEGRQALSGVLSHLGKTAAVDEINSMDSTPQSMALSTVSDLEKQVAAHPGRTELIMQLADLLLDRGEDLKAANRYEQIILLDAKNLEAWSKGIEAYARADEANRAIELSDQARLLFPGYVPTEVAHVFALRAAGRIAEARSLAEQILQRPADPRYQEHVQRMKRELDDA